MRTRFVNLKAFVGLADRPFLTEFVVENGRFDDASVSAPDERVVGLGRRFCRARLY